MKNVKKYYYGRLTIHKNQIYPNLKSISFGENTIVGLDYNNYIWKLKDDVMIRTELRAKKVRVDTNFFAYISEYNKLFGGKAKKIVCIEELDRNN